MDNEPKKQIELDVTPVKMFVRYSSKFIGKWHINKEYEIIDTFMYEFLRLKNHLVKKLDTDMAELIYCEVQLIKQKNSL